MAEKSLTDLGANCSQTTTDITLNKADLGLTGAICTLDQIIAAIAIKAKTVLTQEVFNNEPNQNVYLSDGFSSFTTKGETSYQVKQITINLAKLDDTTLNPNDY